MILPDKYIRKAYINAIKTATSIDVYDKNVPVDKALKGKYVILDSQSRRETTNGKQNCYEWLTTININIYNVNTKGYTSSATVDDLEEDILEAIENVNFDNFYNKNTKLISSQNLSVETTSHSIDRKVLVMEIWTNYAG